MEELGSVSLAERHEDLSVRCSFVDSCCLGSFDPAVTSHDSRVKMEYQAYCGVYLEYFWVHYSLSVYVCVYVFVCMYICL